MSYRVRGTVFGIIAIAATDNALTNLWLPRNVPPSAPQVPPGGEALLREAFSQLEKYFQGKLREFSLPLAPQGTPFQMAIWQALRGIPYGTTATYGEIARRAGYPTATRAVGGACHRNPLAIVIPCHRVVAAGGRWGGFGGGLEMKKRLLALEGVHCR